MSIDRNCPKVKLGQPCQSKKTEMNTSTNRNRHVEHAIVSASIAGAKPSKRFLELAELYKRGEISAAQMVAEVKIHHMRPRQ